MFVGPDSDINFISEFESNNLLASKPDIKKESNVQQTLKMLQSSPTLQAKWKTRKLRDSELTYFGIVNNTKEISHICNGRYSEETNVEPRNDVLNAVRLVQQASRCTTKDDIDNQDNDSQYQNIPMKLDFTPIPTPRSRVIKYELNKNQTLGYVQTDIESDTDSKHNDYRRSRLKKNDDIIYKKGSRSLSEPSKKIHSKNDTEQISKEKDYFDIKQKPQVLPR